MKRLIVLAMLAVLALTACSSAPLNNAYTAAGDATHPDELAKTETFRDDDDLNVVVTLNSHNHELAVHAIFFAPDGATYATDVLDADETVGEVLLGLDWEAQGSFKWPAGEWRVDVFIDDAREKSLDFQVEASEEITS